MRVKCIANLGLSLGPYRRGLYYTDESRFPVTIGKSYTVYAMELLNDGLILLLADDNDSPTWLPLCLFEVEDPHLPSHWQFAKGDLATEDYQPGELISRGRWGYHDIVHSEAHLNGLTDGDPRALRIFDEERVRRP